MSIKLQKIQAGQYKTADDQFQVINYMGVWTVIEGDYDMYHDFLTLAEAREFIAEQVAA
jgi:hypothetical protein